MFLKLRLQFFAFKKNSRSSYLRNVLKVSNLGEGFHRVIRILPVQNRAVVKYLLSRIYKMPNASFSKILKQSCTKMYITIRYLFFMSTNTFTGRVSERNTTSGNGPRIMVKILEEITTVHFANNYMKFGQAMYKHHRMNINWTWTISTTSWIFRWRNITHYRIFSVWCSATPFFFFCGHQIASTIYVGFELNALFLHGTIIGRGCKWELFWRWFENHLYPMLFKHPTITICHLTNVGVNATELW